MAIEQRCYIHVGLPKTGTSYLQSIFWGSRGALAEQGLQMLPSGGSAFGMMLALRGLVRPDLDGAEALAAFDRFCAEASAAMSPRVLISQELLGAARAEHVETLMSALEGYETHLVVTVRDLAGFTASAWQQHVKARGAKTYDEYLEGVVGAGRWHSAAYDIHGVLDRWTPHFPADRVHIVTVPRRSAPRHLLLDRYCRVLGIDPDRLATAHPSANTSLGLVQAELLRRVNVALGDRLPHPRAGYREQGKTFLGEKILHAQQGRPPQLPARLAEWCLASSQAMVDRLGGSGYDIVGDLCELMPDASSYAAGDQHVTDTEVAEAAVEALASILAERAEDRRQLARLRDRVRGQRQRIEELSASAPASGSRLRERLRVIRSHCPPPLRVES